MRQLLLFLLLVIPLFSKATHIVGGGFDYRQANPTEPNLYKFRLTLYFDDINGNPDAQDDYAKCFIFEKNSNILVDSLVLWLDPNQRFVPFTNPECANNSAVRTRILIYENAIDMLPEDFSNPAGYYIIWERCCRNNIVSNIQNPQSSGQTFYMEFPSVVKNGSPFSNASPEFIPILSDYPCINEPFALSFLANDLNGDSLFYSLVNPLRGNSTSTSPKDIAPLPAPYPVVIWAPGYNALNAIQGNPGLTINSSNGALFCKPNSAGLYVFSVKCEEFRNGVKIGEVRREMQLLVKDCQQNTPPSLSIRNDNGRVLSNGDTLTLFSSATKKCYTYRLSEKQLNQKVKLKVIPLNGVISNFFSDTTLSFSPGKDTLNFNFCVPACTTTPEGQPWKILFLATDNGCPVPKSDTLALAIEIRATILLAPTIQLLSSTTDTLSTLQTERLEIRFNASQAQNGPIAITSFLVDSAGHSIPIETNGIKLPSGVGVGGIQPAFEWPEICYLPEMQPLKLMTVATTTICNQTRSDTTFTWIYIVEKRPSVTISSTYPSSPVIILNPHSDVSFTLTGTVSENRTVTLSANGSLSKLPGYSFSPASAVDQVSSVFRFQPDCSTPGTLYEATFIASNPFCNRLYEDTIRYQFNMEADSDSLGLIPNLLTNNEDDRNDGFSLEKILPKDNCYFTFDFIEVYSRWGTKTFFSRDRDFLWKPGPDEEGIFFFALHFKERTYKDWVLVIR